MRLREPSFRWGLPLLASALLAYAYVLLEWLFFATKPSFLGSLSAGEAFRLVWIAPLAPALVATAITAVPCGIGWLAGAGGAARGWFRIAWIVPATIAAFLLLILLDNFTYTLFGVGIRTTGGALRWLYATLAAVFFAGALRQGVRASRSPLAGAAQRGLYWIAAAFALLSLVCAGWAGLEDVSPVRPAAARAAASAGSAGQADLPNILLLASDGLNADNLALYGHRRPTTPFLSSLAPSALVCENALANASNSAASIGSLLTGKLPTRTRLVFAPDILRGRDSYEHLPGILRSVGYRTISMTDRIHADPFVLNLRDAFDSANFRALFPGVTASRPVGLGVLYTPLLRGSLALRYSNELYFLGRVGERIGDRVLHVVGARAMEDPYSQILVAEEQALSDPSRMQAILDFVDAGPGPVFAHLHLYGTHGPHFSVRERRFSRGLAETERWNVDFYDDAVLEFDRRAEWMLDQLRRRGGLERWVVVVSSDHGMRWRSNRVPLLFLFPGGEPSGRVRSNCQLLDVAPTLLDYLGLAAPPWMTGRSLLRGDPDPLRPIFRALPGFVNTDPETRRVSKRETGPPFFGLGFVTVTVCDRSYRLNLMPDPEARQRLERYRARHVGADPDAAAAALGEDAMVVRPVLHHTQACEAGSLPARAEVRELLLSHLRGNGYSVSSLE